jgi:hypothetical protein
MAIAFVLLTIDKVNGTPSTALGPLMKFGTTSLSKFLKSMEDKDIQEKPECEAYSIN